MKHSISKTKKIGDNDIYSYVINFSYNNLPDELCTLKVECRRSTLKKIVACLNKNPDIRGCAVYITNWRIVIL